MQVNVFYVELLGDEKLSGVLIPVIIDSRKELDHDTMARIARLLNNYRTVYLRGQDKDSLDTLIYSVHGQISDCLYGNVATVYSLADSSFIRGIETGDKTILVRTQNCQKEVKISYKDRRVLTIDHQIDLPQIVISDKLIGENYTLENVRDQDHPDIKVNIMEAQGPREFSRLRKSEKRPLESDYDNLIIYYDQDLSTIFLHLDRTRIRKNARDSHSQIGIIISYLLARGHREEDLKKICHVLSTGQYAVLKTQVKSEKISITMEARTMMEGILNI